METRIEVIAEGNYEDAFREGIDWLPTDAHTLKKLVIEVKPTITPKRYVVVIKYNRKEKN